MCHLSVSPREHPEGPVAFVRVAAADDRGVQEARGWLQGGLLPAFNEELEADLRWLLEDAPRLTGRTAALRAEGAERRLRTFGDALFEAIRAPVAQLLGTTPDWSSVELCIDDPEGLTRAWPWELMSDSGTPVSPLTASFTRAPVSRATARSGGDALRMLMVVSRPRGDADVPFRSVASRILDATRTSTIDVEVLRPPTFEQLAARLTAAHDEGRPFDVVHFDGHGELSQTFAGTRGVLVFEHATEERPRYVDGRMMGELLRTASVPTLVLNACRSGYAPQRAPTPGTDSGGLASASFAEETVSSGATAVLAMSHDLYVGTAAAVMQDVYACLTLGRDLGSSVAYARRRWQATTVPRSTELGFGILRQFGHATRENEPAAWPAGYTEERADDGTPPSAGMSSTFDTSAPFIGRDGVILRLERALEAGRPVVLTGLRGTGKTAVALELGRWLAASKVALAEEIVYVPLRTGAAAEESLTELRHARGRVLLVDDAQHVLGDPLRAVHPWTADARRELERLVRRRGEEGTRVLLASTVPLGDFGEAEVVRLDGLPPHALREILELRGEPSDEESVPTIVLHWTAGVPGLLDVVTELSARDAFASVESTQETLIHLRDGRFSDEIPPPSMEILSPLLLSGAVRLFEPDVGLPWMVLQFQGVMDLSPMLWEVAEAQGVRGWFEDGVPELRARHLHELEVAGLVAPRGEDRFRIHPLAPSVVPHPFNQRQLATDGYIRNLARLKFIFADYTRILVGTGVPLGQRLTTYGPRDPEILHNLLQAWAAVSGDFGVHHTLSVGLARALRPRLLDLDLDDVWDWVFHRTTTVFDETPPPHPDRPLENPRARMTQLLASEAARRGDTKLAESLRRRMKDEADAAGSWEMTPDGGDSVTFPGQRFESRLKLAKSLESSDPEQAVAMYRSALEAAGGDPARQFRVHLDLARLLRTAHPVKNLTTAEDHAREAVAMGRRITKAGLAPIDDLVEATLTLSLVLFDQVQLRPDEARQREGERLCQESHRLAEDRLRKANAAHNLGNWRGFAEDWSAAADHYLEAADAYEALGQHHHTGIAQTMRARALFVAGDRAQAGRVAMEAMQVLDRLPHPPKQLLQMAFDIARAATDGATDG